MTEHRQEMRELVTQSQLLRKEWPVYETDDHGVPAGHLQYVVSRLMLLGTGEAFETALHSARFRTAQSSCRHVQKM